MGSVVFRADVTRQIPAREVRVTKLRCGVVRSVVPRNDKDGRAHAATHISLTCVFGG